jgi:hypothetical protein
MKNCAEGRQLSVLHHNPCGALKKEGGVSKRVKSIYILAERVFGRVVV